MNRMEVSYQSDKAVLYVEGSLKTADAAGFKEKLMGLVAKEQQVLIDMEKTDFICSAVLRAFLAAQEAVDGSDGKSMVIKNVNSEVMEVFDMTGFANILTIEP